MIDINDNPVSEEDFPIINAHSHVFTSKHVPPYLAKKFMPFPLYYIFHLGAIVGIFKFIDSLNAGKYKPWRQSLKRQWLLFLNFIGRNPVIKTIWGLLGFWLTVLAFYILFDWIVFITNTSFPDDHFIVGKVEVVRTFLIEYNIIPKGANPEWNLWKTGIVLFVLFFVKSGRNLIFFVFKSLFSFFKLIPGKQTQDLLKRYLLIAKYAKYKTQSLIFGKMKDQYPPGSGFVLLPMDMAYMEAGKIAEPYEKQLSDILRIKISKSYKKQGVKIYPFIFIDPRRISEEKEKQNYKSRPLFDFTPEPGKVIIKDCLVQRYIEKHGFNGFKIYPALGYYPFAKELLAVWKYAEQNNLPITTHCIKGSIFFRGKKRHEWDTHPVFKDEDVEKQLLLPEIKNVDFQLNFTHPMNYLCLLEEPFLRELLTQYNDSGLNIIFGYSDCETPLKHPFKNLKICMAHYGGEEHWERYLEKDSYSYIQQIIKFPGKGLTFFDDDDDRQEINYNRLAQYWKNVDWYTIISSMMMQYPNVYADISYILHSASIFPLLRETLDPKNGKLPNRVLYGTDFYVVRNHNSEKGLFVESHAELTTKEFDLIARLNPHEFLSNTVGNS